MKCRIHFFLLNEHFSIEHAEAHHAGEESETNRKYEWEDELEITTSVNDVVDHEKAVYPIQGEMGDGKPFQYDIPNMRLFELKSENQSTFVGCSESILDSFNIEKTEEETVVQVFLKDYEPMSNPIPGIYIASQEFPKELIQ